MSLQFISNIYGDIRSDNKQILNKKVDKRQFSINISKDKIILLCDSRKKKLFKNFWILI